MSFKGKKDETVGYLEEEAGELLGNKKMAQKGRRTRNAGLIEDGKAPKVTPVGSGN